MEIQVVRTQSLCVILSEGRSSSFLPRPLNIMGTRLRKTDVQCDPVIYLSTIHEM
jgi:hypothetical protein